MNKAEKKIVADLLAKCKEYSPQEIEAAVNILSYKKLMGLIEGLAVMSGIIDHYINHPDVMSVKED